MATITDVALPIDIAELRQVLHARGVIKAELFGSYARGEQTTTSDIDLLVKCGPGMNLFDVIALEQELEALTDRKVDIVTKLNRHFAPYIEPELVDLGL